MAVQLQDLNLYLSGGATNTDPNLSLGGVISGTTVKSELATAPVNITGVTIFDAIGNGIGAGTLTFTLTGQTLQWTPPGGSIGAAVTVSTDGRYTIQGAGAGYLIVDVVTASLPTANATDTITISANKNGIFDDVLKTESFTGDIEYRCLYLKNDNPIDTAFDVLVYIGSEPTGTDSVDLMVDPAGAGDGVTTGVAQTVVNENTPPANGTFSRPLDIANALSLGQLNPGQAAAFWIRRSVPALNITTTTGDTFTLSFKAFV